MNHLRQFLKRALVWAVTGTLVLPAPLYAASTDISDGPLAQPATSVKPNMMLIVDDSGSMARQFTPDYLHSNSQAGTVANCFDALDSGAAITSTPEECYPGDPPMHSPDFNTQYYNPEIRYFPAVTYDGTSKGEMDATATTNWTAVPTDNVSVSTNNVARKSIHLPVNANSSSNDTTLDWAKRIPSPALQTMDLVNGFPDRLWCNAVTPANTSSTNCKTNSGYTYPEFTFGYGKDSSGNRRYVLGAPYYYRIEATEHCTDANMTTCVSSTSPTTVAGVNYPVPAPIRFCNSTAMTNCQAKRSGSYIYPKFLGTIAASVAGSPGAKSVGTIRLATTGNTLDSGAPTVTLIRLTTPDLTTVDVVSSSTLLSATNSGAGRVSAMSTLRTAINAGAHGYKACVSGTDATFPDGTACGGTSGTDLRIQAPAVGVANDGTQIAVTAPVTSTTPASLTFAISSARSGDSVNTLAFVINGVTTNLITSAVSCPSCTTSNSSSSNNNALAGAVRSAITSAATGFTSSGSGANVTITAPTTTGSELNNIALVWSDSGLTDVSASLSGGISVGDLSHSTINFGSGANAVAAATAQRLNTGSFVRTNIVSGQTYTKYPARSDCTGSACSYDEEMTNFANWFAYYRTRIQMARTSLGRAFLVLGSSFRVGIMSINFSTTHYLAVADFSTAAGGQKSQWYDKLYNIMTDTGGSTPLRRSLARAGQYYAGKRGGGTGSLSSDMGASPIQLACQPSYSILTSDGTWNDASTDADDLDGNSVGNQDSGTGTPAAEIAPYVTKASGSWDGNKATNTLADVAMYYYKNDLRTDLADQVPPSGIDIAPHQHMTTFTVGMGLAGTLNYDPNYQEQQSGDFFDIKQGTKLWPSPSSNNETAIDDLWHAAVNGRGRFFSAQDPVTLADGISETLNSVQARIGAGAAAATSNLQPIAGDNFAFTAQYQTVEWSGDLKARTIDLSSGAVATRELWSAQSLLDQRAHTSRRIYTYDAGDTDSSATVTVASASRAQNANRLRSFCPKDTDTATNANCDDGGLLTTSEMNDYFDPDGGTNSALDQAGTWAGDGSGRAALATPTNLIQFLRGDATNEMTAVTATGNTDLYRNRTHLLGDIVNAQPAYVKLPPFGYSDPFYSDFKTANATRSGRVYAAANDGMLHAFITDADNDPYYQTAGIATSITSDDTFTGTQNTNATTGDGAENWAYIPGLVIPKIKRLAEAYYSSNHAYTVDGTPVIADVCFGHSTAAPCSAANKWRTVLVAGLNNGGNGYYALDVTDPANPKALWELKGGADATCIAADGDVTATSGQTEDCNIGRSFGNPIIAKLPSNYVDSAHRGKWVAIVTSGHNNIPAVTGAGDGKGHFYVVEVETGKILKRTSTPAGDTTTPSGLSRINAWVEASSTDNTALTVYGGDLMGNLWRYQLDSVTNTSPDDNITSGSLALLASVKDPSNAAQSITTRPELGEVLGNRVIYVATGKFLGTDDKSSFQRQTVYAIKDQMTKLPASTSTAITDMTRSGAGATSTISGFVRQTVVVDTSDTSLRTVKDPVTGTPNTVNFSTDKGFFIDLPDGGSSATDPSERVNVDPILQLGTLVVPSNVPSSDTCVAGGFGWVNFFDYRSGSYVPGSTSNAASQKISASLIVGINVVQLPGGTVKTIVTTADNQQLTQNTPVASSSMTGRRVSWRELFVE
jgi:type IV pilus assembly protein PilY1